MSSELLYLIQDGSDIGTNTYKVGRTTKLPHERLGTYPKNTRIIRFAEIDNCVKRETQLIELFSKNFKLVRGREFFNGNINHMKLLFDKFCKQPEIEYNLNNKPIFSNDINTNTKNQNFLCTLCSKNFDTKQHLEAHLNKKNKCNNITNFQCPDCNKYFKYKKNLDEHIIKQTCAKNDIIITPKNNLNIESELIKGFKAIINSNIDIDTKIDIIKHDCTENDKIKLRKILESNISNDNMVSSIICYLNFHKVTKII